MRIGAILIIVAAIGLAPVAQAKRMPPPVVPPVERDGIRYVAPNDSGRIATVQAWDMKMNTQLWSATIFKNTILPFKTECLQQVYIRAMELQGDRLIVTSETRSQYSVNLKTRDVFRLRGRVDDRVIGTPEDEIREAVFRYQFKHVVPRLKKKDVVFFLAIGKNADDPGDEFLKRFGGVGAPIEKASKAEDAAKGLQYLRPDQKLVVLVINAIIWTGQDTADVESRYYEPGQSPLSSAFKVSKSKGKWIVKTDPPR